MATKKKAAAKGSAPNEHEEQKSAINQTPEQSSQPHISTAERMAAEIPAGGEPASRPKSGETLPGEPTPAEVIGAALNEPSKELVFMFDGRQYGVVDLTLTNSLRWFKVLLFEFEGAVKSFQPLVAFGFRAWPLAKRFIGSTDVAIEVPNPEPADEDPSWQPTQHQTIRVTILQNLRAIAVQDGPNALAAALYALGVETAFDNQSELIAIQTAAKEGREFEFLWALAQVALKPLAEPAMEVLGGFSFAAQIYRAAEKFPEMALLSITSAMKRLGEPYDEDVLREKIELMDVFDLFEIVCKQWERYVATGKIAGFTGRGLGLVTRSISIATPSA